VGRWSLDAVITRLRQPSRPQRIEDFKHRLSPLISTLQQTSSDDNVVTKRMLVVIRRRSAVRAGETVDVVSGVALVGVLVELATLELEGVLVDDLLLLVSRFG
jgi:hypothetical protein